MPFDIPWGEGVYAKVSATNIVGTSPASPEGNGAIILTVPNAPTDLANNAAVTSASQIGLTWSEGPEDGGSGVIDYRISYAPETETVYTTKDSITTESSTITGLTTGVTYKIKVQARNIYGFSDDSNEILVLVAQIPDAPIAPTTTIQGSNV